MEGNFHLLIRNRGQTVGSSLNTPPQVPEVSTLTLQNSSYLLLLASLLMQFAITSPKTRQSQSFPAIDTTGRL